MSSNASILEIDSLCISLPHQELVSNLSLTVQSGKTLALVGESGSGKSLTCQAILGLFSSSQLAITNGSIYFRGENLLLKTDQEMQKIRGKEIAFIPQNPMSALNPTLTIGFQLMEVTPHLDKKSAKTKALQMLKDVGISDPEARFSSYPHTLSGGQKQRVLIAMSLMRSPKLLIADEPTTALDVTIQAEILQLLKSLQNEMGMALLFVTHDLGIVAQIADHVAVMYKGKIVELATVDELFYKPAHPYTKALLASVLHLEANLL